MEISPSLLERWHRCSKDRAANGIRHQRQQLHPKCSSTDLLELLPGTRDQHSPKH